MYDLCVIGAGLIGSSVAKYASQDGSKVCLIGPEEKHDTKFNGKSVYGCWFDEARLYSAFNEEPIWSALTRSSIKRFGNIAADSGIDFYEKVGYLESAIPIYEDFDDFKKAGRRLAQQGSVCHQLDSQELQKHHRFFRFPADSLTFLQPGNEESGYLNPRSLVEAQKFLAVKFGCRVIRELVLGVNLHEDGKYRVEHENGSIVTTKIILCMGSYTGIFPFVHDLIGRNLDISYTAQTLAFLELSEEEAERLRSMPTMVTTFHEREYVYVLPPIQYPDGKFYLKFGTHDKSKTLKSLDDITEHYEKGPRMQQVQELTDLAKEWIRDLSIVSVTGGSCVTSNTRTKSAPYIDLVSPAVGVATGGCGTAAMCCDEIGRKAARMMGRGECPGKEFKAEFKGC